MNKIKIKKNPFDIVAFIWGLSLPDDGDNTKREQESSLPSYSLM
jgi:hypothetical protein